MEDPSKTSATPADAWHQLVLRTAAMHQGLLSAALREVQQEQRRKDARRILVYRDDPRVKPHLQPGEWTGLGMAANLLHSRAVEEWPPKDPF